MNFSVSVNIISDLISFLCDQKANREYLLSLANTTEAYLSNIHNRLPADCCEKIWLYAEEHTKDECVGLHCGERKNTAALGLISPLIQSCPDIITALYKTSSYINILSDAQRIEPLLGATELIIDFNPHAEWSSLHPTGSRHVMACTVAFAVKTMSSLAGTTILPAKTLFNFPLSSKAQKEYEKVLECEVGYDEHSTKLVYDKKYAYYPIQSRNIELMKLIEEHIKETIIRYKSEISFSSKVKQRITEEYKKGTPTIEGVAKALAFSTRNLQRKLREEATTFQDLLTDIKKEMAEKYLKNERLSISEISYMLGYAEPAVFTRAYKKWTGVPPETARNKVFV